MKLHRKVNASTINIICASTSKVEISILLQKYFLLLNKVQKL